MAIWWTKPQQTCSKRSLCIQCIYAGLCMDGIYWSLEACISPSVFVPNWGKDPWNTNFTFVIRNTMYSCRQLIKLHNIYDLEPKGVHARGYALQLKIKHCWKLFLFEMLCCVLAWMNEYIVQIISAPGFGWFQDTVIIQWKSTEKWPPKTDIHVPSDFRHFAYKQIASTWRNNHWIVHGKHHFIQII